MNASLHDAHINGQVMRTLLQSIEQCGLEPLRYLPQGPEALRALGAPGASVGWNELVDVLEAVDADEGRAALVRVAGAFAALHPGPRLLFGYLLSPRLFFFTLGTALSRAGCCAIRTRDSHGHLDVELKLERGQRPSEVFFAACGHGLEALPRCLGMSRTKVEVLEASATRGLYRVVPGQARGLVLNHSEAQLAALSAMLVDLASSDSPTIVRALPTVAVLEQHFQLTRAEARVARRLAMGRNLQAIARELGISQETARTHAKRAMQKTQTHRQAELVSVVLSLGR